MDDLADNRGNQVRFFLFCMPDTLYLTMHVIFSPPPQVSKIAPASGSSECGATVRITGGIFRSGEDGSLRCRIGETVVAATFLSPTSISCALAGPMAPGAVEIAVTENGVDFANSGQAFTFLPTATVTAVIPSSGPFGGGLPILLKGTGFSPLDKPACSFGGVIVAADEVISSTEVRCVAPVMPRSASAWSTPLSVSVRFSNNGEDFDGCDNESGDASGPESTFLFYHEPVVSSLTPSRGVTNGHKSTVALVGSSFVKSGGKVAGEGDALLLCRLGQNGNNVTTTGIVLSPTEANCPVSCGEFSGRARFELSLNGGVHWSTVDEGFRCDPLPTVSSVSPEMGPTTGGTTLTIKGSGFASSESLSCTIGRVGDENESTAVVSGLWISSSVVECVTVSSLGPTVGEVAVSNDGINFSPPAAATKFEYVPQPMVTQVTPDFASVSGSGSVNDVSVKVTGTNVVDYSLCSCHFTPLGVDESGVTAADGFEVGSSVAVAAKFLSTTEVSCSVPGRGLPVGPTLITVSVNGVDFDYDHGAIIELEALPQVSKVVPARGMVGVTTTPVEVGSCRQIDDPHAQNDYW